MYLFSGVGTTFGSLQRWIISNKKMSTDDVGFYCDSLRELFLQPNKNLFDSQLDNKKNRLYK